MQEKKPAISVIIPMYNTRAYVKECVDSVLAQTFRDFEVILVDDCSTDGSLALCRNLYGDNPRVAIYHHEKNGTVGAARNTGMKAAQGKYIAFLDSDDLYMPDALECLYRAAEEYQADVVHSPGCYLPNGDVEHITVEDEFRTLVYDRLPMPKEPERLPDDTEARIRLWAERRLCTAVWGKLFRRDFLLQHQIRFEENIVPGQDGIFLFRCVLKAENFIRIPEIFCIYRRPATSVTHSPRDAAFLAKAVVSMLRKLRSLEAYMNDMECFARHPEWKENVRRFAILDTDPFFAQECYLADGSVAGDMSPVHQAFRDFFGGDAWFVEYFFHAYHRVNVKNAPERGVQMNYIFPWHLFHEGSRVVIYGAGEVGKCFYEQAARFSYVDLAGIVDRNADKIHTLGIPVQKVEVLSGMEFNHILISVINRKIAEEIRKDLICMGIEEEKILWDGETYSIDDHYRKVFFPLLRSRQIIVYGAGLNAQEYVRRLERQGRDGEVLCFAVTRKDDHPGILCGKPLLSIDEAVRKYPAARIVVVLQEKYHEAVWETLWNMGKEAESYIGLHSMTRLLGAEGLRDLSGRLPDMDIKRKPMDYSMLYLSPKDSPENIFELYPMAQVPLSGQDVKNLRETVGGRFEADFGSPSRREAGAPGRDGRKRTLFLAMAASGKDEKVAQPDSPPYLHRVLAGACSFLGRRRPEGFYDDTGENISPRNPFYSELTVAYWLWKNAPEADYLGLCHYRRHFLLDGEALRGLQDGEVDLLAPRPRLTFPNVRKYFSELPVASMDGADYEAMMEAIRQRSEEDAGVASRIFEGNIHFPNNMLIARRDIFGEYCKWMFGILEAVWQRGGDRRPPRYMGYLGELLTTLFLARTHGAYRVEYVDYELLGG